MPAGRPSEYKEEYIPMVTKYIKETKDKVTKGKLKVSLPTIEGFSIYLDVSKKTLYNWGGEHKEFLHALGEIEREQKKRLLDMGLSGDYNSTIAKLILSVNHGMSEKSEVDHNVKSVGAFNFLNNGNNKPDNKTDNKTGRSMENTDGQGD